MYMYNISRHVLSYLFSTSQKQLTLGRLNIMLSSLQQYVLGLYSRAVLSKSMAQHRRKLQVLSRRTGKHSKVTTIIIDTDVCAGADHFSVCSHQILCWQSRNLLA